MDLQREFGSRVREVRGRCALTQKQLAERCGNGFAAQRVGQIERGESNVTLATVAALCQGLGCDPLDLFLFDETKADRPTKLPNRRLMDIWGRADDRTKRKMLRVLKSC
ncbi:MAG: helix-turn-helix transcriptional regulator [Planctomycetes bacterium]|nr:helix-turn-helix transcriptional regulator [Planctomycetota bacterium]